MKLLGFFVGLILCSGIAQADVFFEERVDAFKIPVTRSTDWVVAYGASELQPRGAIYEVNTLTGHRKELYGFADSAYFTKTVDGNYVFVAEGEYSVSIVFYKESPSDRFTASIKFSGKNAPFEGISTIEGCQKFANVK